MPKGVPNIGPFERNFRGYAAFAANDRGLGHNFWVFHGINYLSGYPFRGIYRGDQVYRGAIFSHIMANHLENGALTQLGRECLVWASATAPELFRAMAYIRAFAKKYKCVIVFKGPTSIAASPKEAYKIEGGNAGLTKGGTGDVLAGLTTALFAQNDALLAVSAASFAQKKAAEELALDVGNYYNADDLANQIPYTFNRITG